MTSAIYSIWALPANQDIHKELKVFHVSFFYLMIQCQGFTGAYVSYK